jgi:hypothetical protein
MLTEMLKAFLGDAKPQALEAEPQAVEAEAPPTAAPAIPHPPPGCPFFGLPDGAAAPDACNVECCEVKECALNRAGAAREHPPEGEVGLWG